MAGSLNQAENTTPSKFGLLSQPPVPILDPLSAPESGELARIEKQNLAGNLWVRSGLDRKVSAVEHMNFMPKTREPQ